MVQDAQNHPRNFNFIAFQYTIPTQNQFDALREVLFYMDKSLSYLLQDELHSVNSITPHSVPNPLGRHLIADFFGAAHLRDPAIIENILIAAALAAGAKVLGSHIHDFGEGKGVTGVVTLAESHMSIHSWPEHDYAAIDIFMCGDADPMIALKSLEAALQPSKTHIHVIARGKI